MLMASSSITGFNNYRCLVFPLYMMAIAFHCFSSFHSTNAVEPLEDINTNNAAFSPALMLLEFSGIPQQLPAAVVQEQESFIPTISAAAAPFVPLLPPAAAPIANQQKRTMRNALIRFGRRAARSPRSSSSTMRNALVRFGKRSFPPSAASSASSPLLAAPALIGIDELFDELAAQQQQQRQQQEQQRRLGMMLLNSSKRNSAPQPFVRFGRSTGQRRSSAAISLGEEQQQQQLLADFGPGNNGGDNNNNVIAFVK